MKTATVQLYKTEIAIRESARTEFYIPQNSFREITAIEGAASEGMLF
nr:hypothetical protein [Candidatus Protochlamydia sp. W-9]